MPASTREVLRESGRPLDPPTRHYFQSRLKRDLGHVRIHTGTRASDSASALAAQAYTVGNQVVFGRGTYAPETPGGRRLIAHELAHTYQQGTPPSGRNLDSLTLDNSTAAEGPARRAGETSGSGARPWTVQPNSRPVAIMRSDSSSGARYTPEQREAMRLGNVTSTHEDREIAAAHRMEEGDVVFRLGSANLARLIDNPVTHGGIYLGNGLIHDMVGFGNRTARLSDFYAEADDPGVVRVVRFIGPARDWIIDRLMENIGAQNFHLPSDSIPFNLFSRADDYETATCLEYSHAQFLFAIHELEADPGTPPSVQALLRSTYFTEDHAAVRDLIRAQTLARESTVSPMDASSPTEAAAADLGARIGPGLQASLMVTAADLLADDVDPSVFENRWEGRSSSERSGPWYYPMTTYRESIDVFTYRSFIESTRFFQEVP